MLAVAFHILLGIFAEMFAHSETISYCVPTLNSCSGLLSCWKTQAQPLGFLSVSRSCILFFLPPFSVFPFSPFSLALSFLSLFSFSLLKAWMQSPCLCTLTVRVKRWIGATFTAFTSGLGHCSGKSGTKSPCVDCEDIGDSDGASRISYADITMGAL